MSRSAARLESQILGYRSSPPAPPMAASAAGNANPASGGSTQTPDASGNWTVVLSRRRLRRAGAGVLHRGGEAKPRPSPPITVPVPWSPSDGDVNPARVAALLDRMRAAVAKLEASSFSRVFLAQLRGDPRIRSNLGRMSLPPDGIGIVVYGVGSIESYEPSRLQLALAILLRRELGGAAADAIEVFDPVLSASECAVVEAMGCKVARMDEGGRRAVERATLFYMPYCEATLYDNLMAANWGRPVALGRMTVLGNSFSAYGRYVEERLGGGGSVTMEKNTKFILRTREFLEEIKVQKVLEEREQSLIRAFNEMSWHFFRLDATGDTCHGE